MTAASNMRLPTFLIVGVAKAGTTALYHHLAAHPEVFMSPTKELNYFVSGPGRARITWNDYLTFFTEAGNAKAIGEASPRYFHDPKAPAWTHEALPGVRIIVLLRQPVERARSHYLMLTNNKATIRPEPFAPFFRRNLPRIAQWDRCGEPGVGGLARSFYGSALERWLTRFGSERVAVLLHEELREEPTRGIRTIYEFLEVDPDVPIDGSRQYNVGRGLPRSARVQRLLARQSRLKRIARLAIPRRFRRPLLAAALDMNEGPTSPLSDADRNEFTAVYRDDIRHVEALLGRDLSHWYTG